MMNRETKLILLAVVAISVAANVLVNVYWTGTNGHIFAAESPVLYDEASVAEIYQRVSPATMAVYAEGTGENFDRQVSSGSGFLVDQDGHIITSNHVVNDAESVWVSFSDGRRVKAEVQAKDLKNDLALLTVKSGLVRGIEPLAIADSSTLDPGEMVIIVGNPFGMNDNISVGVTSGMQYRYLNDREGSLKSLVRTDAFVGPGSSGGPMLNSSGMVVGVITAVQLPGDETQRSMGFAIPSNSFSKLMAHIQVSP